MAMSLFRGVTVRLSAVREEDGDRLSAWYEDGEFLRRYAADPAFPRSGRDIAAWLLGQKPPDKFLFAIRPAAEDGFYGIGGLDGVLPFQGIAGLHMAIGRPYWGQGFGREALSLLLAYAFGELNLRRVQLTVFSNNLRAIRLYEGAGFRREGVYREFLRRDGEVYDMYLYGLLRREWEAAAKS
jgi:RimJ/RimL family protein N-acetyltransferase